MKNKVAMIVVILVVVVGAPALAFLRVSAVNPNRQSAEPTPTPGPAERAKERRFPEVRIDGKDNSSDDQKKRSKKYDAIEVFDGNPTADEFISNSAHWLTANTALPVKESDLIVVAKVLGSTASLSSNKKSVFSQFQLEINKVLSDKSETYSPQISEILIVERDGGVVIFPNGVKLWYFLSGQNMPVTGENYVFFLTHNFPLFGKQPKDLYLLTGYRLKDGVVYPLDLSDGNIHPLAKTFRGKSEASLISALKREIETLEAAQRGNSDEK